MRLLSNLSKTATSLCPLDGCWLVQSFDCNITQKELDLHRNMKNNRYMGTCMLHPKTWTLTKLHSLSQTS